MELVWAVPAHGRHRRCRSFFDFDALLAAAAASVASAGTAARTVGPHQRQDRSYDGEGHEAQDDQAAGGHSATASSFFPILFMIRKGSFATSRYTRAATDRIAMTIPDISAEVPQMRLPITYTMEATMYAMQHW